MSKRRVDPGTAKRIALERMEKLMCMSFEEARAGNDERARRYVELARRIGMKTRSAMPADARYCKACMMPFVPGVSCSVRLGNHKVTVKCLKCGRPRRIPYLREQRNDRTRSKERTHETRS